jgi:hypothetical protein
MNVQKTAKKFYFTPHIIEIKLDNEISLALESTPPTFESRNNKGLEYFNNEPFKTSV